MSAPLSRSLATDVRALDNLRRDARTQPEKAVKQAATQFETLIVQMLLKSMREATPSFDPLASSASRTYQSMLDEQWAKVISEKGIGLAPLIEKQLARNIAPAQGRAAPAAAPAIADPAAPAAGHEQSFVNRMLEPAMEASRATGLPASYIVGQAALESGWGRHEIRGPGGAPSHNLFGIKAGAGWRGATVEAMTTEYVDGQPRKQVERFRAYGSYADAFSDYARLLTGSPRYARALEAREDPSRFAQAIARAGYATDPAYAAKLAGTIRRTISASA